MYQFMDNCLGCAWEAIGIDGVECKVIYENIDSGQRAVLTKLAAGAVIPRHHHTHANETVYVLDGDFIEEGCEYLTGSYFVGEARTAHGPHTTKNGCTILTQWSGGPVDFVLTAD
jgi:anti-sigma factor ChrR (cupin superfamily)